MIYDFAIIGSGVSGGRMAYELTKGGARCVLLEAGREFSASTFPDNELDASAQLYWGGGVELSIDGHLGFLRGKCLGGTSVVNNAILDRFDVLVWDDWRERSGAAFLNEDDMAPHYDACAADMQVQSISPEHRNRNARLFTTAFDALGYGWRPLDRAQSDCALDAGSDCMRCLGGCARDSKQSSLVTTIRRARALGLEVRSSFEVHHVEHRADAVRVVGAWLTVPATVEARKVVLAAGAFGNSAILLRSPHAGALPALGRGFACHPQYITFAAFDEPVNAHKGAFQAVKAHDPELRAAGLKLENVFAPAIAAAMLMPAIGPGHQATMRQYQNLSAIEVAIRDEPAGRIRVTKSGRIMVDKPLTDRDRGRLEHGLRVIRELYRSVGARELIECRQSFGLHLMGGCALGTNAQTSVVTPEFAVHGLPNLIAADSSVFPTAPGINPSFTIMALSHRAARGLLQ